jgi:hypothetical protein
MPDSSVIANRDEAIPVLVLPDLDSNVDGRERVLGHSRSSSQPVQSTIPEQSHGSAARDRLRSIHARASAKIHEKMDTGNAATVALPKGQSMQDRMTSLYV